MGFPVQMYSAAFARSPGTLRVLCGYSPGVPLWVLSGHSRVLRVLTLTATITFASVAARSWSASSDGIAAALARPASAGGTSSRSCRDVHAHAHAHAHTHNHAYRCTYPPHTYTHLHCERPLRCRSVRRAELVLHRLLTAPSRRAFGACCARQTSMSISACMRGRRREREDTSPSRTRTASKTTQLAAGWGPLRKQTRRSPKNRVRD